MTRIAVGGFLHETNTFAPTRATYADFVHGGGWPGMAVGAAVLRVRNVNVGLAGFLEAAEVNGWELAPTISCAATPCAHVTEDAFERIAKVMVDGSFNENAVWYYPEPSEAAREIKGRVAFWKGVKVA